MQEGKLNPNEGKLKALQAAMAKIEKDFGKGSIMKLGDEHVENIEVIPTGSIALDNALGVGGYPKGRIIEIYGPESSGKTTLAIHAIAEAQKAGGIAAFIDAEHAFDRFYAAKLGVDVDNLWISQPDNGEQALQIADQLISSAAVDIVVVDSVAALTPKKEIEGDMGDNVAGQISVSDATAHAACLTAKDVNASAIVTVSESGNTARLLSKYRPSQPIIACVMDEQVQRQLSVSWGITPLMMDLATSTDELIEKSTALAKEHGYLHDGELAVVTAGVPVGVSGTTNMIKIHMIGNCLSTGVGVGPEGSALANATGKACVCRTIEEIRAKFKPGMVLVVPSTSNEMLSYVRDAAALVVEEAGLNSHAAIAGKALLKPTIVGAVGATAHIRDGLMVAVDCAHGSVQRLQA